MLLNHDPSKTKIGLALGSGAARGWALIGVLKVLREAGLKPDMVAGTSIGAITGAALLTDQFDELTSYARSMKLFDMVTMLDISLSNGGLVAPERIAKEMQANIADTVIEDLSTPFACVATNLASGREVWLNKGSLKSAIWASAAMPGLMPPVGRDGRWLVDGALVNPVPVSVCRAMGADIVIAINLNADLSSLPRLESTEGMDEGTAPAPSPEAKNWLQGSFTNMFGDRGKAWLDSLTSKRAPRPNPVEILVGSLDIFQDRMARARLAADPPDILLEPPLGPYGALDFQKADELIDIGVQYTESHLPMIAQQMRRFENH
ncbi:MAG: patatin-like phospholipase family protein [Alphaproteobacteria bacterium]|nr:patatin-like phospholipase family protein [Alphaproteobacteria bacterium SS10]